MEPSLELALEVRLRLKRPRLELKPLPVGGSRLGVQIESGDFEGFGQGKDLRGTVLPGGGEWPHVRTDGVFCFDARYHLKTEDGVVILIQNRGYRYAAPEVADRLWALPPGETVPSDAYYMRCQTTFETAPGKYDWLCRHVIIGVGERLEVGNRIRYYIVR